MPLDPSLYIQGAALQQKNADNLQAQLAAGVKYYTDSKQKKAELAAKGLDLDKLIDPVIIKAQSGQPLTAADNAVLGAWQSKRATEQMTDAYGNVTQKYLGIDLPGLTAAQGPYQPTYAQNSDPFPAGFPNGSPDQAPDASLPSVPMSQSQTDDLLAGADVSPIKPKSLAQNLIEGSRANGSPMAEKAKLDAGYNLMTDQAKDQADQQNPMKYNGEQNKASAYAKQMREASDIISSLPAGSDQGKQGKKGVASAVVGAIPSFGAGETVADGLTNALATPDQQKYLNAANAWLNSLLRQQSGATVTPNEIRNAYKTYFPVLTDKPDVIQQKAKLRAEAEDAMSQQSGGLYELQNGAGKTKETGVVKAEDYFKN